MIEKIEAWHRAARENPDAQSVRVQLGCHFEELVEMLYTLEIDTAEAELAKTCLTALSRSLKAGTVQVKIVDELGLLDSLCDQIVTAVGVGYCAGFDVPSAVAAVNESNWSKFVDGKPLRDENGKIAKGPNYKKPELNNFIRGGRNGTF